MAKSARPSSAGSGKPPKRAYHSELRSRQAQQTREQILVAASELFSQQGYSATSLAQIGRRAGVSTESVAAQGPKRDLLIAAFERSLGGREGRDTVSERPEIAEIFRGDDPRRVIEAMADVALAGQSRSIGIWQALTSAATEDPTVAELYRDMSRRRRADNLAAITLLAERGFLRSDKPLEELSDTLALLSGFDPYQLLVREFGWSEARLRQWFISAVTDLLLAPPSSDR